MLITQIPTFFIDPLEYLDFSEITSWLKPEISIERQKVVFEMKFKSMQQTAAINPTGPGKEDKLQLFNFLIKKHANELKELMPLAQITNLQCESTKSYNDIKRHASRYYISYSW